MKKLAAAIVALIAVLGIAVYKNTSSDPVDRRHMSMEAYDNQAVMFASMMIPHHKQAIELANLALSNSSDADIKVLASKIQAEQQPEIRIMKRWIKGKRIPDMKMEDMPGYISKSEITSLGNLRGKAFDKKFLTLMISHHRGAIQMAGNVNHNKKPSVASLSETIISTQNAEIDEMNTLLKKIS